jgi:hypothetical protein
MVWLVFRFAAKPFVFRLHPKSCLLPLGRAILTFLLWDIHLLLAIYVPEIFVFVFAFCYCYFVVSSGHDRFLPSWWDCYYLPFKLHKNSLLLLQFFALRKTKEEAEHWLGYELVFWRVGFGYRYSTRRKIMYFCSVTLMLQNTTH